MPTGVSIHIGVNSVDPTHYGEVRTLQGCVNDANAMATLAKARGFDVQAVLVNDGATTTVLRPLLAAVAPTLDDGDMLLLTFSGHGSRVPNDDGTLPPGSTSPWGSDAELDQTWCLHDRQYIDDELYAFLHRLKAGVRVLVLSDSCYSGTMTKQLGNDTPAPGPQPLKRGLTDVEAQAVYRLATNQPIYQQIQADCSQGHGISIKASVILLAACQDFETALDGSPNGKFTAALLEALDESPAPSTYLHLHERIYSRVKDAQTPNYFKLGVPRVDFDLGEPLRI